MYYARFFSHVLCDAGMTSVREPFKLQLTLATVHSDCYQITDSGKYLPKDHVLIKGNQANLQKTFLFTIRLTSLTILKLLLLICN